MRRRLGAAAVLLAVIACVSGASGEGDNYTDPAYARRDLRNAYESIGRLPAEYTNVEWLLRFRAKSHELYLKYLQEQALDPKHPAITLAFLLPGGMVGNVDYWNAYDEWSKPAGDGPNGGRVKEVRFRRSTGALIRGHVWRPPLSEPGPFPAISITPGSIQVSEPMYWWAAEMLADHGYVVLSFDAQGQGRSETFGHDADAFETPNFQGVPAQQGINFLDLTVEAVEFLLSRNEPGKTLRYAFPGDQAAGYDEYNPFADAIEYLPDGHANVGLAGHSFGAQGVSFAQDPAMNRLNVDHIRTIVAWDNLDGSYAPHVPAMGQNGESFIEPSIHFSRPDPEEKKGAFNAWRWAGVDTMQVAPRAATHLEWSYVPILPLASSQWGNSIVAYYTLAWFDKYLKNDPTADGRLLTKDYSGLDNPRCGGEDNCYSIYFRNAYWFHSGETLHACNDVAHIASKAACPDTDL